MVILANTTVMTFLIPKGHYGVGRECERITDHHLAATRTGLAFRFVTEKNLDSRTLTIVASDHGDLHLLG